jgi:1-deoxy-D-xylulose-5-phosphate reductoisomerase
LPSLDLPAAATLEFFEPNTDQFPCLRLAYAALRAGGTAPAVLNAANEVAVAAFLSDRIPFMRIPALLERVVAEHPAATAERLEDLVEADRWARDRARSLLSVEGTRASAAV